mmetsp:Transcript_14100/g.21980  ORF Transcript_14100/g.21980 Transcript_14100/m.21980 type:complete len:112 (-) Transcript_14100:67-402(-)
MVTSRYGEFGTQDYCLPLPKPTTLSKESSWNEVDELISSQKWRRGLETFKDYYNPKFPQQITETSVRYSSDVSVFLMDLSYERGFTFFANGNYISKGDSGFDCSRAHDPVF